jgi:thiol-disulfide isomerase/thioredoxin
MFRAFMAFLLLACVALCVLVVRLSGQNRQLRGEIERLNQALGNNGLPIGEILPELSSFGPSPGPIKDAPASALRFDDGRVATVLFVFSGTCGNCDAAVPQLTAMASSHRRAGLEFVGVQSDAMTPGELTHTSANFPIRGVPGAAQSWLRRVPLVPAILIVDHEGVLRAAWYGAMNERQQRQFRDELDVAAGGYSSRRERRPP